MRNFLLGLLLLMPLAAGAAPTDISVAPMKAGGEHVTFPRLIRFPDSVVQVRVNAILSKTEAEEYANQRDCLKQVLDEHKDKSFYEWFTNVEVAYLSRQFLSLQLDSGYDCAGAHPDSTRHPITIDLRTGTIVDWTRMFRPGVLNNADKPLPNGGRLHALYLARYIARNGRNDPDDCVGTIRDDDFLDPAVWLDVKSGGLMVSPQLAHVVAACSDDISISPDQLASLVTDPGLVEDLRAAAPTRR